MSQHLVLTIRFHDRRYHGESEWPPAPARVFQALIAGAARGQTIPARTGTALEWMEHLPPPIIAAPRACRGSRVDLFVPNNDADAVGGDPTKIGELRTRKEVHPHLLDGDAPLLYAWPVPEQSDQVHALVDAANELYQLGRGVDMAWASGEVIDETELSARLAEHGGTIHRPGAGHGEPLLCPGPGSLASLTIRHRESLERLRIQGTGRDTRVLFSQPPKPRFKPVEYGTRVSRRVFELRDRTDESRLWPWPLDRVAPLIDTLRERTANRLEQSFPELAAQIARSLRGSSEAATNQIQILPLPSIGHVHVDRAIRRLAVDVPGESGLPPEDVFWAFTNVEMSPDQPFVLVESSDQTMLARFVPDQPTRRWRSITPVVVAEQAKRRRIEPSRRKLDAKGAIERRSEETRAVDAVRTALNQIGVRATLVDINLQREPFDARGARAERFAKQAAFAKERMWHVEMELSEPIEGPLVIGDGRFVGLGLMVPVVDVAGVFAFATTMRGEERVVHDQLVRAMRRALMSRVQAHIGSKPLDRFFSGHERDGQPARSETSNHVAIQWDPTTARLLVLAPHVLDHRLPTRDEREHIELLSRALDGFTVLRAGRAGVLTLSLCTSRETDEYRERGRSWMSVRPYTITRHPRGMTASDALIRDVVAECERRNLPRPKVTVLAHRGAPHLGLQGKLRIDFDVVVKGPIALGRTRYLGGGLFRAIQG